MEIKSNTVVTVLKNSNEKNSADTTVIYAVYSIGIDRPLQTM